MYSLSVTNKSGIPLPFKPVFYIKKVLRFLEVPTGELTFTFVTNDFLKKMHQDFLNDGSETDIITFDLSSDDNLSGDIYICSEVAKKQALKLNHSVEDELKTLIIHGILHLLGYDDLDPKSKKIMFSKQDEVFEALQ